MRPLRRHGPGRPGIWIVLGLLMATPIPTRAGFTITDLGVAGVGTSSVATGINAQGVVSGRVTGPTGTFAVVAQPGAGFAAIDTRNLPGINPLSFGTPSSTTTGVDAAGDVVGTYYDNQDKHNHAFKSTNGVAVDLGTLGSAPYAGASTSGVAINGSGIVFGSAHLNNGSNVAFLSSGPGSITPVALPGNSTNGTAGGMNDNGGLVGSYINGQGTSRVFVTGPGGTTIDLLSKYAVSGFGLNSYGAAINTNGDVAGFSDYNGQSHAFLATSTTNGAGRFIDIGTTGGFNSSKATALNAIGQVVGELDSGGYNPHAFLFDQAHGLFDLNTLLDATQAKTWILSSANGINDRGQIVGQGYINGQLHAFLLTPANGSSIFGPLVVPTPPSLVLAAGGLALLGAWGRLRRGRTAARGSV